MEVEFTISNRRHRSKVIKENWYTVWVTAPDGKVIKRHKQKHNIDCYSEQRKGNNK